MVTGPESGWVPYSKQCERSNWNFSSGVTPVVDKGNFSHVNIDGRKKYFSCQFVKLCKESKDIEQKL
jgi:hypothetical protein